MAFIRSFMLHLQPGMATQLLPLPAGDVKGTLRVTLNSV